MDGVSAEEDAGGVYGGSRSVDGLRQPVLNAVEVFTPEESVLVRLNDVSFTYSGDANPSLAHINLELRRNSITTVAGPSGSGKTTLASVIVGIAPHTYPGTFEGDIIVDGLDPRTVELNEMGVHVGLVFQNPELMFCNLRVEDEIAFGPENLGWDSPTIRSVTDSVLAEVELNGYARRIVWQLSGGQVQKLGIACVVAMKPRVLVFDEPTANLDPAAVEQVHHIMLQLRDMGHAVLLLSKEVDEFSASGDQLVILDKGSIQFAGPPFEVLADHGSDLLAAGSLWLPQPVELALRVGIRLTADNLPLTPEAVIPLLPRIPEKAVTLSRTSLGDVSPAVTAKHLRYEYGGGIVALNDVSFSVPPGRFTAIIGQNGAGKSTLAKLMCGLIKPTAGELVMAGQSVRRSSARDLAGRVGLVFQNPEHQFLTDTVFDEVAYTLKAHGLTDAAEIQERVNSLLELLDLLPDRKRHPFALSAGKKRRLGVAAMLAADPKILIVDEPTYGQDRGMTVSLMQLIDRMRERGVTVILISHDMRLVQEYADHVIVMASSRCVFEGSVADLNAEADVLELAALRRPALDVILDHLRAQRPSAVTGVRRIEDLAALYGAQA